MNWKRKIKWWKEQCATGSPGLGRGRRERRAKTEARLGQPFCWSPKQINQGPLEYANWITQMGQEGGYTWQSCYKAATGVGRPRLQALSEINHPCWPLLATLLSPHLCFCFSALVCLFNASSHPLVLFFLFLYYTPHLTFYFPVFPPIISPSEFLPLFPQPRMELDINV